MKSYKVLAILAVALSVVVISFVLFGYISKPLLFDGYSTREYEDGTKEIVLHIENHGIREITIRKVFINHKDLPEDVSLGITYDNGQLVQPGVSNPMIRFFEIDKHAVNLRLSGEEITKAILEKEMTPISYGIKLNTFNEPITNMTVVYQYFGLAVTKNYSFEIPIGD